jgi:hypothetical protein
MIITVKIGSTEHEVGYFSGDPASEDGRFMISEMVRSWAYGYEESSDEEVDDA